MQQYPRESKIRAYVEESFMAIPSDIRSIELAISDWKGVKLHLGNGVVETVYHGHELDFGLWVAQGSCRVPDNLHPLEKTFIH
jgi:hypothetical protein